MVVSFLTAHQRGEGGDTHTHTHTQREREREKEREIEKWIESERKREREGKESKIKTFILHIFIEPAALEDKKILKHDKYIQG